MAQPALLELDGISRRHRGPLQALPGLRGEAKRDPRQARRDRPGAANQVYSDIRALKVDLRSRRRGQEPRDLLRAPGRRRRRSRRPDRHARPPRLRVDRRRGAQTSRRRAWPAAAGRGRPTTGTRAACSTTSATPRTRSDLERDAARRARRLRARVLPRLPDRPRVLHRRVPRRTSTGRWSTAGSRRTASGPEVPERRAPHRRGIPARFRAVRLLAGPARRSTSTSARSAAATSARRTSGGRSAGATACR